MGWMNGKRVWAVLAFLPPVLVFSAWALAAGAMTRGPAGKAAFAVLAAAALGFAVQGARTARGRAPVWGAGTKTAAALNAVLAVYFLIAAPFLRAGAESKAEEAAKANLTALRAAVGAAPPPRLSMLVPERLPMIPRLFLPRTGHPATREVIFGPPEAAADRGVWLYDNDAGSPTFGSVIIDCTHRDAAGASWNNF